MAGVDALCMIVLLRGGWPRPDEPRVRPTRIQLCLAASLFFAILWSVNHQPSTDYYRFIFLTILVLLIVMNIRAAKQEKKK